MLPFDVIGLRRVERRLPQPSHQFADLHRATGDRTPVGRLLRRIIESGNVPTNPCCYSTAFAKGQLCDLARDKTGATGEHTGRRLRELTEEGILEVQYRREHAFYRLKEAVPQLFQ
jgi:hypothetical protein